MRLVNGLDDIPIPPGCPRPPMLLELSHDELKKLRCIAYYTDTIPRALAVFHKIHDGPYSDPAIVNVLKFFHDIQRACNPDGLPNDEALVPHRRLLDAFK